MITNGAISVLNAIPTGIGAGVGVELPFSVDINRGHCTKLFDSLSSQIINHVFGESTDSYCLHIESSIPQGVGLKSSSAYAAALIGEFARVTGRHLSEEEICRRTAESSRELGLSITGGFDDAMAAVFNGIAITDNTNNTLLKRISFQNTRVLISIPNLMRPAGIHSRLAVADFSRALDLLLDGNIRECAVLNGRLVASSLGYNRAPLDLLKRLGSTMYGYSGNGPALFAAVGNGSYDRVKSYMQTIGTIYETRLRGEI